MNWFNDFYEVSKLYLGSLKFPHNKTAGKKNRDQRKYQVLIYTYGLEGKTYNREEISLLLEITPERVRQILKEAIQDIKNQIYEPNSKGLFGKSYQAIYDYKAELEDKKVLSYNVLMNSYNNTLKNLNYFKPYLDLFFEVLDFRLVKIHLHYLKDNDLIITSREINKGIFIQICYACYIVIEKNVIPIEENDLIIAVKRKLNDRTINKDDLRLSCSVINSITNNNNSYNIAFEKLSTSNDMAYRVLFEKKQKMKAVEILREINHRLVSNNNKRVDKISLNSQMNMDSRLVSIGKTGYWALKEWNESSKTMFDLITETLTSFNVALTKDEIFKHILQERPNIPLRSLSSVLYDKRYLKIKNGKFILSEWKELYKNEVIVAKTKNKSLKENPVPLQIKEQIINLFLENNSTEILLSTVVKTLNYKFDFPKASIYKVINENPEFLTKLISINKKIVTYKSITNNKDTLIKSTSVFLSYSWESEELKDKVISFVNYLRNKGFEADMDVKFIQEETALDFNRLMHRGILKYDKIIVILSATYKSKAESFEGGVGKEYRYIIGDIEKNPKKYILTSFTTITNQLLDQIVPLDLKGREIVDLVKDEKNNFQTLFSKLTNTGIYKFSEVAKNTPLVETKKIEPFTLKE